MKIRKITKKMLSSFVKYAKKYASYDAKASRPRDNWFVFSGTSFASAYFDAADFGYVCYQMEDKNIHSVSQKQGGKVVVQFISDFDPFH